MAAIPTGQFVQRVFWAACIVATVVAAFILLALAAEVLLVVFGGILLAVLLRALSDPMGRLLGVPLGASYGVMVVAFFVAVGFSAWVAVPHWAEQIDEVMDAAALVLEDLETFLSQHQWGRRVLSQLGGEGVTQALGSAVQVIAQGSTWFIYTVILLLVGLFAGAQPRLYVEGSLHLVPQRKRQRVREAIEVAGKTLRWFLIGRLIAMILVAIATAAMLRLMGIRLAILLGAVAGLLTFVPYLGPFVGGLPIVAMALLESPFLALWAVIGYTIIQWLEGFALEPMIQARVVQLPPVITITSQMLMGLWVGLIGVAFAMPLAAVLMVWIQMLYIQDVLGDPVAIGGSPKRKY